MSGSPLKNLVFRKIEIAGRLKGAPTVTFQNRKIYSQGDDIVVPKRFLWRLASGFFLPLPHNAFGVVVYPDGTSHPKEGGIHEALPGTYKIIYVDKQERLDFTSSVSEMTTDGERLTLKLLFRYCVADPIQVLVKIKNPIESLIENIEADVAQYIRTHDHTDIADNAENILSSKLLTFFLQRHHRRPQFAQAFTLTGVELKEFAGDSDYMQMRRKARIEERQIKIDKEQTTSQQELKLLQDKYRAENEKRETAHRAEVSKQEARHAKEKQEILAEVRAREIELDDKSRYLDKRSEEFSQIIETIAQIFSSGNPISPDVIKYITGVFNEYRDDLGKEAPVNVQSEQEKPNVPTAPSSSPIQPADTDKVAKFKRTLLGLINPK